MILERRALRIISMAVAILTVASMILFLLIPLF
jgi:hypothetical protein